MIYAVDVNSQLNSLSSHYTHNALMINPAYAGRNEALSATILYRNQWTGTEGAPKTMTFTIDALLKNESIGLGFLVINDNIGVTNEISFIGNYTYRVSIGEGKLAMGIGAGITLYNNSLNELKANDTDDELLLADFSNITLPNFSTGVYYRTKKYFIGFSLPFFISYKLNLESNKYSIHTDVSKFNYFFNTGYIFKINPNIKFFPTTLIKYQSRNTMQVDIYSQFIYKDKIWIGAAYRSKNVLIGLFQYQLTNQLRVAYSYDFNIGKLSNFKSDSHEIMLSYVFRYFVEALSPRRF